MISKQAINNISKKFKSFYYADVEKFRSNFLKLKSTFSEFWDNFNIAYSYKTNYLPLFCYEVNNLGGFAEVVSEMELELALKVGVGYDKIIWNGPIKNFDMLEKFIVNGGHVNIDNVDEFNFLIELSKESNVRNIEFGLRVNFDVGDGVVSRFGVAYPSDDFDYILKTINNYEKLKFVGLHCHFARRNVEFWPKRISGILGIISDYNLDLEYLDFGGGLYGELDRDLANQLHVSEFKYIDYAHAVFDTLNPFFQNKKHPLILIEPGTAIVADCMQYLTQVSSIKKVREKDFVTLYGSQKNISMLGINPPLTIIDFSSEKIHINNADFVGYTCIENDVLYRGFTGEIGKNDFVCFGNCGSYSIVMKPPFIFPNCPIFANVNGDLIKVKREETFCDIFDSYYFMEKDNA